MGIIIRQSIKGTAATYVGAFIGFLTTMFIQTEYLSSEDIGLIRVILDIAGMFSTLSLLGILSSAIRFFPYFRNKENNNNGFFFYLVLLPMIGCILFTTLYILLKTPISNFFIEKSSLLIDYYYWVIPLIVFTAYLLVFETYASVNMRISVVRFNREIWIRILTIIVFLLYGYYLINRTGLVVGVITVYGIAVITLFLYLSKITTVSLKHNKSHIDKPLRNNIIKYSSFMMIGGLSSFIISKVDIFMITAKLGLAEAGIYAIATYIGSVIEIPSRSISTISAPVAAEALKNNNWEEANRLYQKVSLNQLLIGGMIFIFIWVNIDNIFAVMPNGKIYAEGKWVVFFIGLSRMITVTFNFGLNLITFSKYYHWTLYFTFFTAGIGILANYLLIPILGMQGAAIAAVITCALGYGFQQWVIVKKIKGNPYTRNMLKLIVIMIVLLAVNYFITNFADPILDSLIRTFILGVIACPLIYFLNVSEELNNTVKAILKRIIKF